MTNGKNLHEKLDQVGSCLTSMKVENAKMSEKLINVHSTLEELKQDMRTIGKTHQRDIEEMWKVINWNRTKIVLATGALGLLLYVIKFFT